MKLATIVCDTDFLIKISTDPLHTLGFDFFYENELVTLPVIVMELEGLARNPNKKASRLAKSTLRQLRGGRKVKVVNRLDRDYFDIREADHILVEFVKFDPKERMLATLDGSLLSRLELLGLPYLTLRKNRPFFHTHTGQRI